MSRRDEYVQQLKTQIDQWNAELDEFEKKAEAAGAEMREQYEHELAHLRQRRDEVVQEMQRVQKATDEAWDEVWRGAEEAWTMMKDAFSRARSKFNK